MSSPTPTPVIPAARIDDAFELQRANRQAMRARTVGERVEKLRELRQAVLDHGQELSQALNADMGRPLEDPYVREVGDTLAAAGVAIEQLPDWAAAERFRPRVSGPAAEVFVEYQPRGIVLVLGPWNFPLSCLLGPLIAAVAAGNTAIVKPSEMAPATAEVTERVLRGVFEESEVAVFRGEQVETPAGIEPLNHVLGRLPVDHVFLTGSPRVGSRVMAAAAPHLASTTLELGGKSPAIVDGTADLERVADTFLRAKMYNAGQVCLAIDHVWVVRDRLEELVTTLAAALESAFYEDGEFRRERTARLVDRRNFDRVLAYVDEAVGMGATIAFGGGGDADALAIEPTILTDVPPRAAVLREEIFGPVLPILPYDEPAEIYAQSEAHGKPLALYVYSEDQDFVADVLAHTSSGGVTVNGWALHFAESDLPFGGVGSSGHGAYHGVHGFRELSHARAVVIGAG